MAENFVDIVNGMLEKFRKLNNNISIKIRYLFSHLETFPENLGAVSDEQGERIHQDIKIKEQRHQDRWDAKMMANYRWSIMRD